MFNTESERIFQNKLTAKEGLIISEATLKTSDLLDAAYSVLFPNGLNTELCHEIEIIINGGTSTDIDYGKLRDDAEYMWNETIFNYFNEICPDGYYFGPSEGDGACIGFFRYYE